MYTNTGYMNLTEDELENNIIPLRVNSCGVYRLVSLPVMSTFRPLGRSDYQLLYISAGKAFFTIDGTVTEISEGSMVLFPPHTPQQYSYYINNKPEVYWVHFTGSEAQPLTKEAGFLNNRLLYTGISSRYQELFLSIIREVQLTRPSFEELSALYLKQLFLLLRRIREEGGVKKTELQKQMEKTVRYFHENLANNIEIETYARQLHMSTCWFIRSFREYAGMPPGRYLTEIRIKKAKELLESTDYSVGEIGGIIGYENPLYFSRIFKKTAGVSPAEYRKAAR
ncbi:AraC family transcriptional regulator [Clostridium boliviensis]|uniref:AraC family transcriptional regulator n=1 Tax=Clostridium boliviensis TaxID=318465 RepID=A0ABU4GKR6_9CLOT|nr:AraC family transcriptional regulator [Clostridium boliviensis]MDW2798199.1 AraC family transcriptional regulator [Clostridium boliviensis]